MKYLLRIVMCLMIALMLMIPQPAYAIQIQPCGPLPSVIVEDLRNIRGGYLQPDKEFLNNEKKLPSIDRGYMYVEYTLDRDNPNPGDRGKYRAVGRVKSVTSMAQVRPPVTPIYVTKDHYQTFCEAR